MAEFVSAQSGSFTDPATWSPAGVPVAVDTFTIGAGHTVTVTTGNNVTSSGLIVGTGTGTRGTLVIQPDASLTLSGDLTLQDYTALQINGTLDFAGFVFVDQGVATNRKSLVVEGTAGNRAALISNSATNATINLTSSFATLIDYADFIGLGTVQIDSAFFAGYDFVVRNLVIRDCMTVSLGQWYNDNNDWIINGVDIRDSRGSPNAALFRKNNANTGGSGGITELTRVTAVGNATATTIRWEVDTLEKTLIVLKDLIGSTVLSDAPSMSNALVAWITIGSPTVLDNGSVDLIEDSYVYTDLNNPHTNTQAVTRLERDVIEAVYTNGTINDPGDHFIVSTGKNGGISDCLLLESNSGVLLNALGSARTFAYDATHNTLIGNYDQAYGALVRTESGGTFAGVLDLYSNLVVNLGGDPLAIGMNFDSAGDDQVTNMDFNAWWNFGDIYSGVTSATKTPGVTVGYGGNDLVLGALPSFTESGRGLAAWGTEFLGTTTANEVIDEFLKLNGFNPATNTQDLTPLTIEPLDVVTWVREGWTVTDPALVNSGHDGLNIGILDNAPVVGPISNDLTALSTVSNPAAGGDLPSTQFFHSAADTNVLDNFTFRLGTNNIAVVDDGGTPAIAFVNGAVVRTAFSYDPPGSPTDVEILVRIRQSANDGIAGANVMTRGSLPGGNANAWRAGGINTNNSGIFRYLNGTFSTPSIFSGIITAQTVYHWIRFRTIGDSIQSKMWDDGDAEPVAWTNELTDNSIPGGGWVGLFFGANVTSYVTQIGVGIDGASAPDAPVTSPVAVSNLQVIPEVSTVTLSQAHGLTVGNLDHSPELSGVTLAQTHNLTIGNLETQPEVQAASITQTHTLGAGNIEVQPEAQTAALVQAHSLGLANLDLAPQVLAVGLAVTHALSAAAMEVGPDVQTITLGQTHSIQITSQEVLPELSTVTLGVTPALAVSPSEVIPEVSGVTLAQTHGLTLTNLNLVPELRPSAADQTLTVFLDIQHTMMVPEVTSLALTQDHLLQVSALDVASEILGIGLSQSPILPGENLEVVPEVQGVTLSQTYLLDTFDLNITPEVLVVGVSQAEITNLSMAPSEMVPEVSSASLTQTHSLTATNLEVTPETTTLGLSVTYSLNVSNLEIVPEAANLEAEQTLVLQTVDVEVVPDYYVAIALFPGTPARLGQVKHLEVLTGGSMVEVISDRYYVDQPE